MNSPLRMVKFSDIAVRKKSTAANNTQWTDNIILKVLRFRCGGCHSVGHGKRSV
jgi:hypothetical protein